MDKVWWKWATKEGSREEKNMSKENVSLQKLMYMIVDDTLVEIFENISRKRRSLNNLCLKEGGKSLCVWYL